MSDARGIPELATANKMRWSAVFAGVVIALIIQLLLSLLGLGVGLTTVDPVAGEGPSPTSASIVAGLWWIATGVIASGAGGYVAGRSSGATQSALGMLHGLTAWAATILVVIYLLTTAIGGILGGALSSVATVMGNVGNATTSVAAAAAPAAAMVQDPMARIEGAVRSASGGEDPAALRDRAIASVRNALSGDPAHQEQAKTAAVEALARAQNISPEQARQQVDQYQTQYRQSVDQAKETAKQAAETSRKAGAAGSLIAFFALILGAAAAGFRGAAGVRALRGW